MNDTPAPDIPDPTSPTPVTPASRPRRVITRPDGVKASRLPGTYAANYSDDPNWRRGVTVLWLLFGLAAAAEFFRALFIAWSGNKGLPPEYEAGRIGAEAVVFLLLWVGWSWPRWLLVAVDFLFGAWFIISVVAPLPTDPRGPVAAHPGVGFATIPQLALGVIYLASATYLAFSADVIGFVRHRREEGRGWVVVPLILIVGATAVLVCNVQPFCKALFEQWRPEAAQFATESLRDMAQNWDVAAYEKRADPEYLKVWTEDQRRLTFGTLAGFGPSHNLPAAKMVDEPQAGVARGGGAFLVSYDCEFGKVRFAHGSGSFGCIVSRHMFGPWQLENLVVSEPEFDPAPAAPAAGAGSPGHSARAVRLGVSDLPCAWAGCSRTQSVSLDWISRAVSSFLFCRPERSEARAQSKDLAISTHAYRRMTRQKTCTARGVRKW